MPKKKKTVWVVMCEQHYANNVNLVAVYDNEEGADKRAEKFSDYHVYEVELNDPDGGIF